MGEWILKNYAPASYYIGLHFQHYDDFIFPPIIKNKIWNAEPGDKKYYTVYLPSYCEHVLEKHFHHLSQYRFHIFSWQTKQVKRSANITFLPVNKDLFDEALINCTGIITGGGFETPAEALKLGKKLMVIPILGQYEQQCNAAALEQMGISRLDKLDDDFDDHFEKWAASESIEINYDHSTGEIVDKVVNLAIRKLKKEAGYKLAAETLF